MYINGRIMAHYSGPFLELNSLFKCVKQQQQQQSNIKTRIFRAFFRLIFCEPVQVAEVETHNINIIITASISVCVCVWAHTTKIISIIT